MTSSPAPGPSGRALMRPGMARPSTRASRQLPRGKWRRRLATALVFAGGAVAGASGAGLLSTIAPSPARLDARSASSSAYGLPTAPVGLPGPLSPVLAAKATRNPSAPPLEVVVPRIGVRSRLVGLRLNLDGTVQVPDSYGVAGWYRDGPAPGDPGAALILGHVDSTTGPGIFFRLRELRKGDSVLIRRADGTTAAFVVDRLAGYPKARFPAAKVYAGTARPELRLITCSGDFAHGHYLDNLVVFAHQVAAAPARRLAPKRAAVPAKKAAGKFASHRRLP